MNIKAETVIKSLSGIFPISINIVPIIEDTEFFRVVLESGDMQRDGKLSCKAFEGPDGLSRETLEKTVDDALSEIKAWIIRAYPSEALGE